MTINIRKIIAAALLISALFTIAACGPGEVIELSTDDGTLANNEIIDFYFYYPSNWKLDKNAAMVSVYFPELSEEETDMPYDDGSFGVLIQPNLSATVMGLPAGAFTDADDYWENGFLPPMQGLFTDIEVTGVYDVELNGVAGKLYDYTAKLTGVTFSYSQVMVLNRGMVYTLTYTSKPVFHEKYMIALDTAIRTFTFK